MPARERRFQTGFRQVDRNEPGLVLEDDGGVWGVRPDGTRFPLDEQNGGTVLRTVIFGGPDETFIYGEQDQLFGIGVGTNDDGDPRYGITQIVQTATNYITDGAHISAGIYVVGPEIPPVPPVVVELVSGWGADPPDVYDITYSALVIAAVTGDDAGKVARITFDQTIPHPLSDLLHIPSDWHMNDLTDWIQRSGDLDLNRQRNGWHVPSAGFYSWTLGYAIDFFYPA